MEKPRFPAYKTMLLGLAFTVFLAAILLEEAQIEKSEPFTELYFNNYSKLPQNIEPNRTYDLSFTIANRERVEQTYLVRVTAEYGGKRKTLFASDELIGPDQSAVIPVSFMINESFASAKIAVRLDNMEQEIHFWAGGEQ